MPKSGGFSVASKVLERYERERKLRIHKERIQNMKHGIDNSPPKTYPHLSSRLNQLQKDEDRQAAVDSDNRLLLKKIGAVMTRQVKLDNWNNYETRSLNHGHRERLLEQIASENVGIGKRLGQVKPMYDTQKWEKDYRKHNYLLSLRSEETKDYEETTPRSRATNKPSTLKTEYQHFRPEQSPVSEGMSGRTEYEAKQLFQVAKGSDLASEIIIKTLVNHTYDQRRMIADKFEEIYDLNLLDELKLGQGDEWNILLESLLSSHLLSDCLSLRQALHDKSYESVVEMISHRNNLHQLLDSYYEGFNTNLEKDIKDTVNEPIQDLLLKLLEETGTSKTDSPKHEAEMLLKMSTVEHETMLTKVCLLLKEKNLCDIKLIFSHIKSKGEFKNVLNQLRNDTEDDGFLDTLVAVVRDKSEWDAIVAERLFEHLNQTDRTFVSILVKWSELGMNGIRSAYHTIYGSSLDDDVAELPSHPTDNVLLELITANSKNSPQKRYAGVSIKAPEKQRPLIPPQNKSSSNMGNNPLSQRGRYPMTDVKQKGAEPDRAERLLDHDCVKIHQYLQDGGVADEDFIVECLTSKNNHQRQELQNKFMTKYNQNLRKELQEKFPEDLRTVLSALFLPPDEFEALCLHEAMSGLGTDEDMVANILVSRSRKQLQLVQEAYLKNYGTSLVDDVASDTSGHFKKLLIELLTAKREEGISVNKAFAKNSALTLYKSKNKDELISIASLQKVLSTNNREQILEIFYQYRQISKTDIREVIRKTFSGDDELGYMTLVTYIDDPMEFFCKMINRSLSRSTEKFVSSIFLCPEMNISKICETYQLMYKRTLHQEILSTEEAFHRILLSYLHL